MTEQMKGPAGAVAGKPFIFGVSGHRDLVSTDLPELRQQLQRIFDYYQAAYPSASFLLLTPLAEGADRIAAEVALNSGLALHVPIPMTLAEYERDFTTTESLDQFRRLLGAAHSQWQVSDSSLEAASLSAGAVRARKYAAAGDYIAQKSHVLILLWDGRDNQKIGGTSWVKGRREHWMRTAAEKGDAPDDFGYVATLHIVTPRAATENKQPRPRIEIIGGLPPATAPQTDVRSRL
jgi:hypothetical protein